MMTALRDRPKPCSASARSKSGSANPPTPKAPIVSSSRRVRPSHSRLGRPQIESIFSSTLGGDVGGNGGRQVSPLYWQTPPIGKPCDLPSRLPCFRRFGAITLRTVGFESSKKERTMRWFCLGCAAWLLIAGALAGADKARTETKMLSLHTRRQKPVEGSKKLQQFEVVEQSVEWDPKQTALIVCDMWDDHWCQGAARRVVELAGPLNRVVEEARRQGVFIIHAPSTTVDFYADAPQRRRAQAAPLAKTPVPLASEMRWGTCWCWPDKDREPDLPIDDSDMGCDCREKCEIRSPWTRQIASIDIDE